MKDGFLSKPPEIEKAKATKQKYNTKIFYLILLIIYCIYVV